MSELQSPPTVDLRNAPKWQMNASAETEGETASRLRREEEQQTHKLRMESRTHLFSQVVFGLLLLACCGALGWGSEEQRKLAVPILTAMVGGVVGYLFGKKS